MGLPGVKIGPLDPDATERFGSVAASGLAKSLIRLHARAHPTALTRELARKLDHERTKALQLEEVRSHLSGQTLANGDPAVPEGAEVVGASIRGERDSQQVLCYTYRIKPSNRTAKWFVPYDREALPESSKLGDEFVRVSQLRERGVVAFDEGAAQAEELRRDNARLRRRVEALTQRAGQGDGDEEGELPDIRPDNEILAEMHEIRHEREELRRRVAALEATANQQATEGLQSRGRRDSKRAQDREQERVQEQEQSAPSTVAEESPPFEGYEALKPDEVVARLRASSEEDRERILAYESRHQNRRSVIQAGEEARGAG